MRGHNRDIVWTVRGHCSVCASTMPEHCRHSARTVLGQYGCSEETVPGLCHDSAVTVWVLSRDIAETVPGQYTDSVVSVCGSEGTVLVLYWHNPGESPRTVRAQCGDSAGTVWE